jgi:hypothetical protein
MKTSEHFSQSKPKLDLSSLSVAKVSRRQIQVSALVPKRRDQVPINAISQKFHIISRPLGQDLSSELTLKAKVPAQTYDYVETGLQRYFSKDYNPPKRSPVQEFPRIRHKIFSKPCKGDFETEVSMIPYQKRIKTTTDLGSLSTLTESNKELKLKLMKMTQTLSKSSIFGKTSNFNTTYSNFVAKEDEKYEKNDLNQIPATRERKNRVSRLANRSLKDWNRSKSETGQKMKVYKGIVDVSYPYCKCCKRDWNQCIDVQE